MTAGSMELVAADGSESTTLVSNLTGHGNLGQLDIRVDTETDHLQLDVAFNDVDMDFDVEFLGVGIQALAIPASQSLEGDTGPHGMFPETDVEVYKGD